MTPGTATSTPDTGAAPLQGPRRKTDPRSLRTRRLLQQALLDLARQRALQDISVVDVVETAGLNRATFYVHYHDRDELLADAVDTILVAQAKATAEGEAGRAKGDFDAEPPPYFVHFLEHLHEHAPLYRSVVGAEGSAAVMGLMHRRITGAIQAELERTFPSAGADGSRRLAVFLAGGFLGVVSEWLATEPLAPPAPVARSTWALFVRAVATL